MHIAVFGDLHGRILLAFQLAARWQQMSRHQLDLILQVGDLGGFPELSRLESSTRRRSANSFFLLAWAFGQHFVAADSTCCRHFVRDLLPLPFRAWARFERSLQRLYLLPIV